jgi:hypothetical protein
MNPIHGCGAGALANAANADGNPSGVVHDVAVVRG